MSPGSLRSPRKSGQTAAVARETPPPTLNDLGSFLASSLWSRPGHRLLPAHYKSDRPFPPLPGGVAASVSPHTTSDAGGSPGALEPRSRQVEGGALTRVPWLVPSAPNPLRRWTAPKLQGAQRPLAGSVVEYTTITGSTTYSTSTSTTTRRPQRAGPTERSRAQRSPTAREHHGAPPGQQEVPPPRRLGRTPPVPAPDPDAPPAPPPQPAQPPQPPDPVETPPPATVAAAVADVVAATVAASAAPAALAVHPAAAHLAGPPEAVLDVPAGQEAALPAQTFGVSVLPGPPAEGLAPPPPLPLLLGGGLPAAGAVRAAQGQEGLPHPPTPLPAPQQTALAIPAAAGPAPSRSFAGREPKALAHTQHEAPAQPGQGFGHQEDHTIQKNHRTFWKLHQLHQKSIIFIRDRNAHGQELSGYIDYAHRLKMEDFEVYFTGNRKLLPRPTDLSFLRVLDQMPPSFGSLC
ncbi:cilia- and flagella-associated protein 299 isoform X2 [Phascolarctos cinereus]|uniref:Cilia- and flagella-associated protein 299 n=1 Tax=Phascolarctos cinereus TaxID=38626 RepID=A0A6P5KEP8_PHACI|nr:uncharacterized protein C4orf22 homolog isoform X1 [Phascolarctos cinereus]